MLKFLRKYNTIILVVGGVFLMIAFLLPQAIGQMAPNFGNTSIFKAGGRSYSAQDVQKVGAEFSIISQTFDPVLGAAGQTFFVMGIESPAHYLLLAQMAEEMGLMNAGAEPGRTIPRIADAVASFNLTDDMLVQMDEQFRIASNSVPDPKAGERALRRLDAIVSMRQVLLTRSSTLSSNEQAAYAANLFTTFNADIGVIPASTYAAQLEPPTEGEINDLFQTYRDQFPADNDFGFSYRLDNALKFEMLTIERGEVSIAIELDPVDIRKHHRENWETKRWAEDYQDARKQAEDDLRNERTDATMNAIRTAVNNVLVAAQNRLERGPNGLRKLPDDWKDERPTFARLAEVANEAAARLVPGANPPAVVRDYTDKWYTRLDINTTEGVQLYRYRYAGRLVGLGGALTSMSVFNPPPGGALPEAQVDLTLTGITSARLPGGPGNDAFVRVLETRLAGPPETIDPVREDVVADATTLKGYNALVARQSELRELVLNNGGLLAMLYDIDSEGTEIVQGAVVSYYDEQFMGPARPNVLGENTAGADLVNTPGFAQRLIELTSDWDPTVDISTLPVEQRTFSVEVPEKQTVAVVTVTARRPVTAESLRFIGLGAWRQMQREISETPEASLLGDSLSFRNVAERMNFEDLDTDDDINPLPTTEDADTPDA